MRRVPALIATLVIAIVGVACGGPAASPSAASSGDESAAPGSVAPPSNVDEPVAGGTLVEAINGDPPTINSSLNWGATSNAGCKIQEGLISANPALTEFRPELAERWEVSSDGQQYTFYLREDVTWHDGMPFTSADVKWSFENVNTFHPFGSRRTPFVESIETPDDYTVVLNLSRPWAPLLITLDCALGGAISPMHSVTEGADVQSDETLNRAPVGTGPFTFQEWVPGDRIVLQRNEDYWKDGLPYLDEVVIRVMTDRTAMTFALRAGELNYISQLFTNLADINELSEDPELQSVQLLDAPSMHMVAFNLRRPPLDNVEVRRALMMALDRQLLQENFYEPLGEVSRNMIDHRIGLSANPDADISEMYPFDIDAANALLDEAGFPRDGNGERFELGLLYEAGRLQFPEVAEVIVVNWAELGVNVQLEAVERAVMIERGFQQRDFDAFLQTGSSYNDPELGVARFYVCEDDAAPVNFGNPTGYCSDEVDSLFTEAGSATSPDDRGALYRQLQEILADDLPLIPIMSSVSATLMDKRFDYSSAMNSTSGGTGWESVYEIAP